MVLTLGPSIVEYVRTGGTEPKRVQDASFDANRLLSLRTRNSAAYKGIHALLMRSGCHDFLTGTPITMHTFFDDSIDIHHIFPQKWCSEVGIDENIYNSIVNKTALSARTNRIIGGQAPSIYLARIEADATLSRAELTTIVETHGINPDLLYTDGFNQFFAHRGRALVALIGKAMGKTVAQDGADFLAHTDLKAYEDEEKSWAEGDETWEETVNGIDQVEVPVGTIYESTALSDDQLDKLKKQFHQAMIDIYQSAKRELGYTATYFLQMVSEMGGIEAARRLLAKTELSDGFTELYLKKRLDLTVEAHVVRPEFRVLFSDEEIATATKRLTELGYMVPS